MADITKLKGWVDAYGSAVRSGVLTPCREDEVYLRKLFGLPEMPEIVSEIWTDMPTRLPTTIFPESQIAPEAPVTPRAIKPAAKRTRKSSKKSKRAINPAEPRLEDSEFEQFDLEYALDLKANWPDIWSAGGNIRGNEAFEYWQKAVAGDLTEGTLDWIVEREAWSARHFEDGGQFRDDLSPTVSNVGGIVAQIKWGMVGTLGLARMKDIIEVLKAKLSPDVE